MTDKVRETLGRFPRIQLFMNCFMNRYLNYCNFARMVRGARWTVCAFLAAVFLLIAGTSLRAQQPPEGPMAPPPEHHVERIGNTSDPGEPPTLPIDQVIKKLTQQEDTYAVARSHYTYRKTIRIQEFGPDGKPAGEYVMVTEPGRDPDGGAADKVVERPHSTLQYMPQLESEDFEALNRVPAFPLTTSQLAKYDLKYLGKDQVDEISCYIFEVKPRVVERQHGFFKGIVWIDDKYLDVVKSYGSWVNDLGDMKSSPQLPFTLFETYREFVDGKYWFPTYARSDETLHFKDHEVPVRMIVKWSDYKPVAAGGTTGGTGSSSTSIAAPPTPAPAGTASPAKPPQ
jgi:hypothetical protein